MRYVGQPVINKCLACQVYLLSKKIECQYFNLPCLCHVYMFIYIYIYSGNCEIVQFFYDSNVNLPPKWRLHSVEDFMKLGTL